MRPGVATLLQAQVGVRQRLLGWARGELGLTDTLLLEIVFHWGGLRIMLFLIMGEGTHALSAPSWYQLLQDDGLEKGQLLVEV